LKKNIRKTIQYTAITFAALSLILALVLFAFGIMAATPRGQQVLIGIVNDQIPGQISLKSLGFSLSDQEVKIQGFNIQDPVGKTVVEVEQMVIGFDLSKLPNKTIHFKKIQISSPGVSLVLDEENVLNLVACFVESGKESEPTTPETSTVVLPFNIIVERLLIEGATLSFESRDLSFKTEKISLEGSGNLVQRVIQLDLLTQDWSFSLPPGESPGEESVGKSFNIDSINLDLTFDNDSLTAIDFSVRSPLANLGIRGGAADLFNIPRADLKLNFMADLGQISSILPGSLAMEGAVKGDATLTGTAQDPELVLLIASDGGKFGDESFDRTTLDFKIENRVLTLKELTTSLDYGKVTARANVDLTDAFPQGFMGTSLIENIRATLDLTATEAGYGSFPRGDGKILLAFSNETLEIKQLDINLLDSNFFLAGTIKPMDKGRLAAPEKIVTDLEFRSTRIILENFLEPFLAKETLEQITIGGVFTLNGSARGDLGNPTVVLNLAGEKILLPGDGEKSLVNNGIDAQLHLKELTLTLKRLAAVIEGGTIEAEGKIDLTQVFSNGFFKEVNIEKISGTLGVKADDFTPQPILEVYNIPGVHGKLSLDLNVQGALATPPQATLNLTVTDAGFQDSPRVDANFSVELLEGVLEINKALVVNPHGSLTLDGRIKVMENSQLLKPEKMSGNLKLKTNELNPGPILAKYEDLPEIYGSYSLDLTLEGSFNNPRATFNLTATDAGYADFPKADARIDLLFLNDHLEIKEVVVTNPDTRIDLKGRIRVMQNGQILSPEKMEVKSDMKIELSDIASLIDVAATQAGNGNQTAKEAKKQELRATVTAEGSLEQKIKVIANGKVPAGVAQLFTSEIARVEGEVNLEVTALVEKEIKNSLITGRVVLDQISMVIVETEQKLHSINGTILADQQGVTIQGIKGNLDRGSFNLTGRVELVELLPDSFKFEFQARDLPLELPDRMTALFKTDLSFDGILEQGTLKKANLSGEIRLLSGEWTADFNLEKTVLEKILGSQRNQPDSASDSSDTITSVINLDILVRADSPFVISNNLAYLFVTPDLKIGGTVANPSVAGRATLGPGNITYQGRQFEITEAGVDFVDPYGIRPVIDIMAEHQVRDWRIFLKLTGTPDNLLLELLSNPREEHGDILSLLLTGKTTNELISSEGGTTTSPASLVAGLVATSFADRLKKNVGLDVFELDLKENGSGSPIGDVNLTVGKEITDKITVSYGMETKEGEMIQKTATDYKLSDQFSLSGFQNTQGHFGAEVRYRLEFR